jgi:predicted metal-dependent hydrolase
MEEIKYNVIFSRRRTISIIVSQDKTVTVRAPLKASLKTIRRFVEEKSSWIRKHLDSNPGISLSGHGRKYINGEPHLFLGKEYTLRKISSASTFIRLSNNSIEVGQDDIDDIDKTRRVVNRWYSIKAGEILDRKMKEIIGKFENYNFSPSAIVIRPLRSRWGSCTSKGKITLNSELIKLNETLIEYVILHELCHLKYHNHGANFYTLLSELIPEYKTMRRELRKYITS